MGRRVPRARSCAVLLALIAVGVCPDALAANPTARVNSGLSSRDPLVIESAGWLLGDEQEAAEREAARMSPGAVAARKLSRSRFEHLSVAGAAKLASESYPGLVDQRDSTLRLTPGARIAGYPSDHSARVDLGSGEHALIESLAPIALETSHGHHAPVDLALKETNGSFQPVRAAAGVRIPGRLSDGVQLSAAAVSLTPVGADGRPLGSAAGRLDGSTVFYGATGSDADTLVKPTTYGFEEDTLLRSVESPQRLFFRVGLPAGARLRRADGGFQIVDLGKTIAGVPAPSAMDAEGTPVPLHTSLSGDTLVLSVAHRSGDYRYPIAVDPSVWDEQLNHIGVHATNWHYEHSGSAFTASENSEGKGWTEHIAGTHGSTEWGAMVYTTQGESYVGWLAIKGKWNDTGSHIENKILIVSPAKTEEAGEALPESESLPNNSWSICNKCSEEPKKGASGDSAEYAQFATGSGGGVGGENTLTSAQVQIEQEKGPEASFDTTDPTVDGGRPNVFYGSGSWLGPNRGAFETKAHDPGIGISFFAISAGGWAEKFFIYENGECTGGIQCPINFNRGFLYNAKMANGEDTVEGNAYNAMNSFAALPTKKLKVDAAAPYNIVVTGLPMGNEIAAKEYQVQAEATDGTGTTPSSGISSLVLTLDGREIGSPSGSCSPGPCTAHSSTWTIHGEELGAGEHQIKVTATDAAANVASQTFAMKVHHAAPISLGPGTVNLQSGELDLEETDVSLGGGLVVHRSDGSRRLSAGAQGPLGPQWSFGVGDQVSLLKQPNGSMVLTDSNGGQTIFTSVGGGSFTSPPGDANLTLSEVLTEGVKELVLKNAATGASTGFRVPTGGAGEEWAPFIRKGVVPAETVSYAFKTVEVSGKSITEPTQVLAAVPSGVSCSTELRKGCRGLSFSYASSTTATGQGQSEWGEYAGRLATVSFTAYEPTAKEMKTTAVAQYSYDSLGRLRAEWDPRISPALKTLYGYDAAGHLTAVSAAGQQPWLLEYGTEPGESVAGRLLAAVRPSASTGAWGGQSPANTVLPTLSSNSPVVGTKISVATNGTWTGSPLAYSYQWEDCNSSGGECAPILGAVNGSYYPVTADQGHKLVAQVIAVNAGGSTLAASAATSSTVAAGTPNSPAPEPPNVGSSSVWTVDYNVPLTGSGAPYAMGSSELAAWAQADDPVEATAVFPPDEPMGWPAKDYRRASVYYLDEDRRTVNVATPSGGIATSEYNSTNNLTRSLSADARAAALKEGAKSAEVSQTLDTQSAFNTEGTEVLSTFGPQHAVKLSNGAEVQARSHTVYSYDEGAPTEGGPYRLVTKVTRGAEVKGEAEQDKRTTTMSYSGQEGLGWKLRKPTSVTTDPSGLKVTHTTVYDPTSGNTIETRMPGDGGKDGWAPPTYAGFMGSAGTGNGQLKSPWNVTVDSTGHVWVADTSNNRVEEFTALGSFVRTIGTVGTGNGQFKEPHGVAVDFSGHVWVADTGNSRIQEFTSEGAFIRAFGTSGTGNGQFKSPDGMAVDYAGHVWVADMNNNRVQEFTSEGVFIQTVGALGTGNGQFKNPTALAFDGSGDMYVVDSGNGRLEKFNSAAEYASQFGSSGTGIGQMAAPMGISIGPEGNVWLADTLNSRVEEFSAAGTYLMQFGSYGSGSGQFSGATGIYVYGSTVFVTDSGNNRIQRFMLSLPTGVESYSSSFGTAGSGNGQFGIPWDLTTDTGGHVWVADTGNNRVEELTLSGGFVRAFGTSGTGNGQFKAPEGITVDPGGHVWVSDTLNNRVQEFTLEGTFIRAFGTVGSGTGQFASPEGLAVDPSGHVWVADSGNNRVEEFSSEGVYMKSVGTAGIGNGQFKSPSDLAFDLAGDMYVLDHSNHRIQEFGPAGEYARQFGSEGSGNGQMKTAWRLSVASEGNVWLSDSSDSRIEVFSPTGTYLTQFGSEGTGAGKFSTTVAGVSVRDSVAYALDRGNARVERWTVSYPVGDEGAHDTQTIYYSASTNNNYPGCGNHAEWANLPCQVQPTQQPETAGLSGLPVSVYTYNMWNEPATVTQTVGSSTRTTTNTYDAGGRPSSSSISSTLGTALPTVSEEYSSETGLPIKQKTGSGAEEQRISSTYNTLGQLTEYTDADGNTSTYKYDVDGRSTEASDGKGSQIYGYDETTGQLTTLKDSAAGTFTATYDVEGNLLSQHFPNNMNELHTVDATGETTGLEYQKLAHCGAGCTWFKETTLPSIHDETMSDSSTLANHGYTYDNAGRLTQVQETPAGEGCTTRLYEYDKDVNRTALTTRAPGAEGQCATSGGTVEKHTYDSADRLTDEGTSYDAFGNTTSLPAKDAGGTTLTSAYYAEDTLASLTQNGETIGYQLDPARRVRETISSGTTSSDAISHYSGPGDAPTWTVEPVSGNWTRNISGIGGLVATQSSGASPVLQLTDMSGNVVGTAALSETEEKLLSSERATEFGVPTTSKPPKYSWLGGELRPTELPSGVVSMGARAYVPQIGRFEQTDPISGGSANPYAYTDGKPVDETDLTGQYVENNYVAGFNGEENIRAIERELAREQAAQEEAERKAQEAAAAAEEETQAAQSADAMASASSVPGKVNRFCSRHSCPGFLTSRKHRSGTMSGWEGIYLGKTLSQLVRSTRDGTLNAAERQYARKLEIVARELTLASRAVGTGLLNGGYFAYVFNSGPDGSNPVLTTGYIQDAKVARR